MIKFIKPDYHLRGECTEMMNEWMKARSRIAPWSLIEHYHTGDEFEKMIRAVNNAAAGNGIGDFSPCIAYWVKNVETNSLLGAVNIRYYLTKLGFETWGHIGFGVRPGERRAGYAHKYSSLHSMNAER